MLVQSSAGEIVLNKISIFLQNHSRLEYTSQQTGAGTNPTPLERREFRSMIRRTSRTYTEKQELDN